MRLKWEIQKETVDAAVPHMLLQPLVENAIKHGLEAYANAGEITIATRREGESLVVTITDDGPGHQVPSPRAGAGKGIANVKTRLSQLYGDQQSFTIVDAPGGGARVTIRLPFMRTQRAAAADQDGATATDRSLVGSGSSG